VSNVWPALLIAAAGFLGGGAYSFKQQGKPLRFVVVLAAAAVMSLGAGVLYL